MPGIADWLWKRTGKRTKKLTKGILADVTEKQEECAREAGGMAQANGVHRGDREHTPNTSIVPPGRAISTSMMRQATIEQTPSPESTQWSSAVGHASTGKSGRVIERLQQQIDGLNRDKQVLKLRYEESERTVETLNTQVQYLQNRNSNYESTHEANMRQLQRKERQVEDLREEVQKEKVRTSKAEEALRTAAISEDEWKDQAYQAKAIAQQKEAEYDAIAACRNMDNDRHQTGLDRIRAHLSELAKQREEDLVKQKRMEIIAEERKQTIERLEELTKRLTTNFKAYQSELDSAIDDLRSVADLNDRLVQEKVEEMRRTTGEMRWVMNVETIINGRKVPTRPSTSQETISDDQSFNTAPSNHEPSQKPSAPPSPSKKMSSDFRRHRRKDSSKAGK